MGKGVELSPLLTPETGYQSLPLTIFRIIQMKVTCSRVTGSARERLPKDRKVSQESPSFSWRRIVSVLHRHENIQKQMECVNVILRNDYENYSPEVFRQLGNCV